MEPTKFYNDSELHNFFLDLQQRQVGAKVGFNYFKFNNEEWWYPKENYFKIFNRMEAILPIIGANYIDSNRNTELNKMPNKYWSITFSTTKSSIEELNHRVNSIVKSSSAIEAHLYPEFYEKIKKNYKVKGLRLNLVDGAEITNQETQKKPKPVWVKLPGKGNMRLELGEEEFPIFKYIYSVDSYNFNNVLNLCKENNISTLRVIKRKVKSVVLNEDLVIESKLTSSVLKHILELNKQLFSFSNEEVENRFQEYLNSFDSLKVLNRITWDSSPTFRLVEERTDFRIILSYHLHGDGIKLAFTSKGDVEGVRKGNSLIYRIYGPDLSSHLMRRNDCFFYNGVLNNNQKNYNHTEGFEIDFNSGFFRGGTPNFGLNSCKHQMVFVKNLFNLIYSIFGKDIHGKAELDKTSEMANVTIGTKLYTCIEADRHYVFPDFELTIYAGYQLLKDSKGREYILCYVRYNAEPYVDKNEFKITGKTWHNVLKYIGQ